MSQCAALDQDLTEQGLQATYDELILKLAAERRSDEVTHLVESQSAWLTYRESFCGAVYARFGMGTLRGIMLSSCMSERAEIRREELAQFDWP